MPAIAHPNHPVSPGHRLHRILVLLGLVLAVLILVAVAIYAGAFLLLAPMMQ